MPLNTLSFDTLVSNQVTAAQGSSTSLLDFSVGSVLLALIEANSGAIGLWLEGLAVYDLALTRAATSNGADLDSWMADFSFVRNQATFATGNVTFSRINTSVQALIPIGAQLQTATGSVSFTVTLDTTNAAYSSTLNGYVITVSTSSVTVPVEANTAGTIGNVSTGAISIISSPIAYVTTVTNSSAFTNGLATETDAAFRARFVLYINSLSKATLTAIEYAISQVQGVVDYTVTENQAYGGSTQYGYFYVVVDDGTGSPSSQLLSNVASAVQAVVALTVLFNVYAPVVETANVTMTVTAATGYLHSVIAPIVQTAITNYINTLPLGMTLYYSRLMQVAYDASPGVLDVTLVTLNSGTGDLVITSQEIAKAGTVTIS